MPRGSQKRPVGSHLSVQAQERSSAFSIQNNCANFCGCNELGCLPVANGTTGTQRFFGALSHHADFGKCQSNRPRDAASEAAIRPREKCLTASRVGARQPSNWTLGSSTGCFKAFRSISARSMGAVYIEQVTTRWARRSLWGRVIISGNSRRCPKPSRGIVLAIWQYI
jgi:hypothetical protein